MKCARASMHVLLAAWVVLAGVGTARADDTPRQQFEALTKKYDDAMRAFSAKYGEAKTDEERQKVFESAYPKADEYAKPIMELARANPKDDVTFEALVWVVQHVRGGADHDAALAQLARDHVENPKIGTLMRQLAYGPPEGMSLVEAVLERNPDPKAKAQALLTLAQKAKENGQMARRLASDPDMSKQVESFYGKGALEKLKALSPEEHEKKAEEYFERVIKEFSKSGEEDSVAKAAERELFEMRNLSIGKVAPDIEGEDIDGKRFKLSDYRGKVVLLDFWGDW